MIIRGCFAVGLSALAVLTAGCSASGSHGSETADANRSGEIADGKSFSKVLFVGDSIAVGEALPLSEAFDASGVEFESAAAEGGGNVVGPFSEENWKKLPGQISSSGADVVIYQITTYDWGTPKQQQAAYRRLADTARNSGAALKIVTMPPIKADEFYRPHVKDLKTATRAAQSVAKADPEEVTVLDASDVWGTAYAKVRDGRPDRSGDGIHTCPQGAARFAAWLLRSLTEQYPGFAPADPADWANTGWSGDEHFRAC